MSRAFGLARPSSWSRTRRISLPEGKRFAFTILDDTDDATVDNVRPIYRLLSDLNFRTTKTAWPLDCPEGSRLFFAAETLQQPSYLEFVRELIAGGFEFASHGATMESSRRERTLSGLEFLQENLGVSPTLHCNHGQNIENLYWGPERYRTAAIRIPLSLMNRIRGRPTYSGHRPGSEYFWGDIAQQRFRFVRNFTFTTINTGKITPVGPYRLRSTPYVNYWFNTSDAPDVSAFKKLVTRRSIDRLEHEGGVCILSTHLGKGFVRESRVDSTVEETLCYIASRPGWFVPVTQLLEYLLDKQTDGYLSWWRRWMLETRHVLDRVAHR